VLKISDLNASLYNPNSPGRRWVTGWVTVRIQSTGGARTRYYS
jgi:hypothetical protein